MKHRFHLHSEKSSFVEEIKEEVHIAFLIIFNLILNVNFYFLAASSAYSKYKFLENDISDRRIVFLTGMGH